MAKALNAERKWKNCQGILCDIIYIWFYTYPVSHNFRWVRKQWERFRVFTFQNIMIFRIPYRRDVTWSVSVWNKQRNNSTHVVGGKFPWLQEIHETCYFNGDCLKECKGFNFEDCQWWWYTALSSIKPNSLTPLPFWGSLSSQRIIRPMKLKPT